MMRITILAIGTRGDVQPVIALGKGLQTSGHTVCVLTSANFAPWVQSHGLQTHASAFDMQALMASDLGRQWAEHGTNQLRQWRIMQQLVRRLDHVFADIWAACQATDCVISSFTTDVVALSVAERLGIRHLSIALQPPMLATADGRVMASAPFPNARSPFNRLVGRLVVEPAGLKMYGAQITRFRQGIGLGPLSTPEYRARFRQTPIFLGYSSALAPLPTDWPPSVHPSGFWFLDEHTHWQPSAALQAFLTAGPPPVCIGFGSMTGNDPAALRSLLHAAVTKADCRAIILGGWAGLAADDTPTVLHLAEAPHEWLYPHTAAAVHHGGAGTTAASLRAGLPTVIVPHLAEQPFWGRRVAALGAGPAPINRPRLTADNLAAALRQALDSQAMRQKAAALGAIIRAEDGLTHAVSSINATLNA